MGNDEKLWWALYPCFLEWEVGDLALFLRVSIYRE